MVIHDFGRQRSQVQILSPRPNTKNRTIMHLLPYIGLALGLVVFSLLLVWQGITEIIQLLTSSGWAMLLMPIVWLPSLLPTTEAWRKLFKVSNKPQFMPALAAIWMGRAVNNLLPVATIGGEVVKARLIMLSGYSGTDASASVLVERLILRHLPRTAGQDSGSPPWGAFLGEAVVQVYGNGGSRGVFPVVPGDGAGGATTHFALVQSVGTSSKYIVAGQLSSGAAELWRLRNSVELPLSDFHTFEVFVGYGVRIAQISDRYRGDWPLLARESA